MNPSSQGLKAFSMKAIAPGSWEVEQVVCNFISEVLMESYDCWKYGAVKEELGPEGVVIRVEEEIHYFKNMWSSGGVVSEHVLKF